MPSMVRHSEDTEEGKTAVAGPVHLSPAFVQYIPSSLRHDIGGIPLAPTKMGFSPAIPSLDRRHVTSDQVCFSLCITSLLFDALIVRHIALCMARHTKATAEEGVIDPPLLEHCSPQICPRIPNGLCGADSNLSLTILALDS
jgi:hypothetical protein